MQKESVWDYPRPPAVEKSDRRIRVVLGGRTIVDTTDSYRVLETSHPPVYYIPRSAIDPALLHPNRRRTFCEYKGVADYVDLVVDHHRVDAAAWFYSNPSPGYEDIANHLAFYPGKMDECWVDDDLVTPQIGDFYGGWITPEITGPFKEG